MRITLSLTLALVAGALALPAAPVAAADKFEVYRCVGKDGVASYGPKIVPGKTCTGKKAPPPPPSEPYIPPPPPPPMVLINGQWVPDPATNQAAPTTGNPIPGLPPGLNPPPALPPTAQPPLGEPQRLPEPPAEDYEYSQDRSE
jgi:hypothetical protein